MGKPYIFGRHNIACCRLVDELKKLGIVATVGHANSTILYVYCKDPADVERVPKTFDGYKLEAKPSKF